VIRIRFASIEDKPYIKRFLGEHWSESSILVTSDVIFDFQYVEDDQCHFVLAIDDDTKEVFGLKGFFPFNSREEPDIAAALATVVQGIRPMLGMEIQQFLEKNSHCRWLCSTGINPNTSVRVYQMFKNKYIVDTLRQFYRIADQDTYKIAKVSNKRILPVEKNEYVFEQFDTIDALQQGFNIDAYMHHRPYKDRAYLNHRYFCHPVYQYQVLGIRQTDSAHSRSILIAREASYDGAKALRIVDFIGQHEDIGKIGYAIAQHIDANAYEYVDFYCYGIEEEYLTKGGFILRDDSDPNIIPNYFEPFEQKNVDIYFFATKAPSIAVCKADGDQDRPNVLPEGL